uniref:Endothelin receptor A n=1 Tax=Petromyzon marinus TaxID=7757 RepID=S4RJZ8_PETMA
LGFSLLLFAVGLASNLTVICVVCNNRYMKNVSNSLLANMAFWDFLVIFVCLPLTAVHELSKRWVLGDFTCKLVPYLEVASLGITTFTLAALCLDRFHAATNVRLHYEQTEGCISRGGKLAVVWLGALVLSTPELLIHGLAGRDSPYDRCEMRVPHELPDFLYMLSATYRAARPWWFFGCYFCLPIAFTVTCSVLTARRMKGAGYARIGYRVHRHRQLRLERQMNCAVVALATAYACCLVPEIVCSMVWEYAGVGGGQSPALDVLHTVAQYLLFSKSCLSPVLLLGLCRELARAARACCCCC